jgi:flagellar biosynthetic protein FliQ
MTEAYVISIGKQAMTTALEVSAPVLIVALIIGLIISIFQAVTQIQEQTLTFVPKMIAIVIIFLVAGSWMLKILVQFTETMLNNITYIVR